MERMIPPIGTRGVYALTNPWTITVGVIYTCAAIREFVDIENLGVNVFETYYEPMGLTQANYELDRKNNEVIVTLVSDEYAPIYVPSSYIASYPDLSYRNYQHVVLSASFGPLPTYVDLTFVKDQMGSVISDVIGLEPEIHESVAPMSGVVTPDDHESLEAARAAAIQNRTTDRARNIELTNQVLSLSQRLAILEQIVKDNNLLP